MQYAYDEVRSSVVDPHKQTIIDLQYFVQDLQQEGEEVILFLDANQNDQRTY
jgi:predicted AAA+ superfamily ATPase